MTHAIPLSGNVYPAFQPPTELRDGSTLPGFFFKDKLLGCSGDIVLDLPEDPIHHYYCALVWRNGSWHKLKLTDVCKSLRYVRRSADGKQPIPSSATDLLLGLLRSFADQQVVWDDSVKGYYLPSDVNRRPTERLLDQALSLLLPAASVAV